MRCDLHCPPPGGSAAVVIAVGLLAGVIIANAADIFLALAWLAVILAVACAAGVVVLVRILLRERGNTRREIEETAMRVWARRELPAPGARTVSQPRRRALPQEVHNHLYLPEGMSADDLADFVRKASRPAAAGTLRAAGTRPARPRPPHQDASGA